MEQFFEITEKSAHYAEYFEYIECKNVERECVKCFMLENDINSTQYLIRNNCLYVEYENNKDKYKAQFKKGTIAGLVGFKKSSEIGKLFMQCNIKSATKPFVPLFFNNVTGRLHTRLFNIGLHVFCSIDTEFSDKLSVPVGFKELKATEFWKLVEDEEKV